MKLLWSLIYSTCYNHREYTLEITSTNLNEVYTYIQLPLGSTYSFSCVFTAICGTCIACTCTVYVEPLHVIHLFFAYINQGCFRRQFLHVRCFTFRLLLYTLSFYLVGSLVMEHLGSSPSPIQGKPILYGSVHGAVGMCIHVYM